MNLRAKWLFYSIIGLILIGAGLSVFGEALILKMNAESWEDWFWTGTLSLVIFNSGICLFGQGVIHRMSLNRQK